MWRTDGLVTERVGNIARFQNPGAAGLRPFAVLGRSIWLLERIERRTWVDRRRSGVSVLVDGEGASLLAADVVRFEPVRG